MGLQYKNGRLIVWIDGACIGNHGYGGRSAGYGVWFNYNHSWNECGALDNYVNHSNQNAEIEAAIQAIEICARHDRRKIEIRTDSDFLIKSVTERFSKWRDNDWCKTDGKPLKNRDKFIELDDAMNDNDMNILWTHVYGHNGDEGNEEADKLARRGARDN